MTSRKLAELLHVSQPTISRALNDSELVPLEKRRWIQQKAYEYGFVLNSQAQSLRTQKTGTIGILFPKHFKGMNANPTLAQLYDHVQQHLIDVSYDTLVVYDQGDDKKFSAFERIIRQKKVDGLVILRTEVNDRERDLISHTSIPCVFVLNASRGIQGFNYYLSDSEYGGLLVGRFFAQFPEYRKMMVKVMEDPIESEKRTSGFLRGLKEGGAELKEEDISTCSLSFLSAYKWTLERIEQFKKEKTAIFAFNDVVGIGIVNALIQQGIDIPGQVQILGMDDIPFCTQFNPHLSTLYIGITEIADRACDKLMHLVNEKNNSEPEIVSIKPSLVHRSTTIPNK